MPFPRRHWARPEPFPSWSEDSQAVFHQHGAEWKGYSHGVHLQTDEDQGLVALPGQRWEWRVWTHGMTQMGWVECGRHILVESIQLNNWLGCSPFPFSYIMWTWLDTFKYARVKMVSLIQQDVAIGLHPEEAELNIEQISQETNTYFTYCNEPLHTVWTPVFR